MSDLRSHHKSISIEKRAARLEAAEKCRTVEECVQFLKERGYQEENPQGLRSWFIRNNITPRGGLQVRPSTMQRLQAAEAFADRVRDIIEELPNGLSGVRAAMALGEIKTAVGDYSADVVELRKVVEA